MKFILNIIICTTLFYSCSSIEHESQLPIIKFTKNNLTTITKSHSNDSMMWLLAYSSSSCLDCIKMALDLLDVHLKEESTLVTLSDQHNHGFLKANLPSKIRYYPTKIEVPFQIGNVTLMLIENTQIKKIIIPDLADKNKTSMEIYEAVEDQNIANDY